MIYRTALRNKSGFSISEVIVAGTVLALALAVTIQVIGAVAIRVRELDRRSYAREQVNNLMEQATVLEWDLITADSLSDRLDLEASTAEVLPEAKVSWEIDETDDSKRVRIGVSWKDHAGVMVSPIELVSWVYRAGDRS